LFVEFPLDPCPERPGTVAAKEYHLDRLTAFLAAEAHALQGWEEAASSS
jgi:hypothetical protein